MQKSRRDSLLIADFDTDMPTTYRVFLMSQCWDGVFIQQGKASVIIHFNCLLWSSSFFEVVEFTSAFFIFTNVSNC